MKIKSSVEPELINRRKHGSVTLGGGDSSLLCLLIKDLKIPLFSELWARRTDDGNLWTIFGTFPSEPDSSV